MILYIYICFKIFKVDLRGSTIYIYIIIYIYILLYISIYIYIYIHAVGKPWFSDVSPGFRPWWQVPSHFQCVLRVPQDIAWRLVQDHVYESNIGISWEYRGINMIFLWYSNVWLFGISPWYLWYSYFRGMKDHRNGVIKPTKVWIYNQI
jgi:hypothetical protein